MSAPADVYPYRPILDLSNPVVHGQRMAACVRAHLGRYFWLPCPLCGMHFGGHEWLHGPGQPLASSVHLPGRPDYEFAGICPPCTQAGRGELGYPAGGAS